MRTKPFDNRYVRIMWDDILEGKDCFYAETAEKLVFYVNNNFPVAVIKGITRDYFDSNGFPKDPHYSFVYYDPNYQCRLSFDEGNMIQSRPSDSRSDDDWKDDPEPSWSDNLTYRVKPDFVDMAKDMLLMNWELARWLAKGNGEMVYLPHTEDSPRLSNYVYRSKEATDTVPNNIRVRRWGESLWQCPTREYCLGK